MFMLSQKLHVVAASIFYFSCMLLPLAQYCFKIYAHNDPHPLQLAPVVLFQVATRTFTDVDVSECRQSGRPIGTVWSMTELISRVIRSFAWVTTTDAW